MLFRRGGFETRPAFFAPADHGRFTRISYPFSDLGMHERRRIIRKVIWSRGLFRDVSRTLKLLSTFTYYTAPDVREDLGYVDVDDRERAQGIDQSRHTYPVPVEQEEVP